MKALLVADKEPYLHYRTRPAEAGRSPGMETGAEQEQGRVIKASSARGGLFVPEPSITIEVTPRPVFETKADIYIIPAHIFTGLRTNERPHPSFAYGPVNLMEAAFGAGCMDYLREPWIIPELEARTIRYETLRFRVAGRLVTVTSRRMSCENGEPVPLRHGEYVALRVLIMNHCQCVSRETLEFAIWGSLRPKSRSLDVLISSLRSCLEKIAPGGGDALTSSRGFGYMLETESCG